jgi:hypothetical protein
MTRKEIIAKGLAYWVIFLMLHFGYEFLPILPLKLIGATDESFYQNQKVGFFAYIIVNLLEWLVRRKRIENLDSFLFTRMFTSVIIPWVTFAIWYMVPCYYGRLATDALEIIYSNIAVLVVVACTMVLERRLDTLAYDRASKVVIVALLLILISQYFIFTFRLPWADVFVDVYTGSH